MLIDALFLGRGLNEFGHNVALIILRPSKDLDLSTLVSLVNTFALSNKNKLSVIRDTTSGILVDVNLLGEEANLEATLRIIDELTKFHNS